MVWPTLGPMKAKEQNRTEPFVREIMKSMLKSIPVDAVRERCTIIQALETRSGQSIRDGHGMATSMGWVGSGWVVSGRVGLNFWRLS